MIQRSVVGRNSRGARFQELVYRNTRPLARTVQPPAPRIIQNTVHQTVVHLHQTTHQHILNRLSATGDRGGSTMLLVRQAAIPPPENGAVDGSRPALAARRMLRVLSAESARRTLRPFYQKMFRELLDREREEYRNRPEQSLLLVQSVLGRRQTLAILRRIYQRTAERLEETMVRRLIYQRYVFHIRQDGESPLFHRYANHERAVPEDLLRLPAAQRPLSSPCLPEREPEREYQERQREAGPPSSEGLRLSGADFQTLVRGVADALGRQSRLDSLRRGGM